MMNKILTRALFSLLALFILTIISTISTPFSMKPVYANFWPSEERCDPDNPGIIGDIACEGLGYSCRGIYTALGCIDLQLGVSGSARGSETFTIFLLKWATGIGGGLAFMLMVYASFLIITSTGNPQQVQAGKELLTSAITGLLMLIMSIFILRVIGVDILGLNEVGL